MARPIGDNDLKFLENVLGATSKIIRECKGLAYDVDDPDALGRVVRILQKAQSIRKSTISWMEIERRNHNGNSKSNRPMGGGARSEATQQYRLRGAPA
jgi:hypothetical protein